MVDDDGVALAKKFYYQLNQRSTEEDETSQGEPSSLVMGAESPPNKIQNVTDKPTPTTVRNNGNNGSIFQSQQQQQ